MWCLSICQYQHAECKVLWRAKLAPVAGHNPRRLAPYKQLPWRPNKSIPMAVMQRSGILAVMLTVALPMPASSAAGSCPPASIPSAHHAGTGRGPPQHSICPWLVSLQARARPPPRGRHAEGCTSRHWDTKPRQARPGCAECAHAHRRVFDTPAPRLGEVRVRPLARICKSPQTDCIVSMATPSAFELFDQLSVASSVWPSV